MTSDSFSYDEEGRLISKTIQDKDMGTVQTRYAYDKRGNVTSIETGMGIEYITYDKAGRIVKKENSQSGIAKTYTYYPTGLVKDVLTWQNDEVVYTESYEYDQNGNKIYEDLNGEIKRYAYDGMGRLKTVTDKDGNITEYEFDDFGNISKEYDISERGIKTKQYYYDSNNRLIMSDSSSETAQYEYDNSGNLLEKTTGYGGRVKKTYYRYDGYNRLSEYISGDVVSEYTYNLDGLRDSKTVGGKYTRFMYDGMNIIGELCEGDYYIYHRGTELIGYQSYGGKSYYYRQDSHGNVTALLDFAGNEVKNYKYDAYGEPQGTRLNPAGDQTIIYQWKAETERVYNSFGFCGEYTDSESGLVYLRNRYYEPSVGRFISEDPIKDGLNWYVYCGGNPVMFVDPWGLLRGPDYNKYGQWSENPDADDFGVDSAKYKMLVSLTNIWNNVDDATREEVAKIAQELRNADVDNINRIMLLNDSSGASNMGHVAVLLLNENDNGFIFSYYSTVADISSIAGVRGEMRFNVLTADEWNALLYKHKSVDLLSSEGDMPQEKFDRNLYLTVNNTYGLNAFEKGVDTFVNPGTYYLLGKNCDAVAQEIVVAGGKGYFRLGAPNLSFEVTRRFHTGQ